MDSADRHNRLESSGDAILMEEVVLGSHEALRLVVDRYMSMVSRTSYRILCNRADSEDVTQEVFVKVWRNASSYDARYSISTWIYRITVNLCYDRLRRRRAMDFFSISPSVYEASAPVTLSPEEDFITKETWAVFCRASQELSPKQRAVFTLRELEGLSTEETASITGMTTDQIKSNLHFARKRIRQELEKYGKVR